MIAWDEYLTASLESVRQVVDEIILVDTGSRDGTPDLAESLGARVLRIAWPRDFSRARNVWLAEAKGQWIL